MAECPAGARLGFRMNGLRVRRGWESPGISIPNRAGIICCAQCRRPLLSAPGRSLPRRAGATGFTRWPSRKLRQSCCRGRRVLARTAASPRIFRPFIAFGHAGHRHGIFLRRPSDPVAPQVPAVGRNRYPAARRRTPMTAAACGSAPSETISRQAPGIRRRSMCPCPRRRPARLALPLRRIFRCALEPIQAAAAVTMMSARCDRHRDPPSPFAHHSS